MSQEHTAQSALAPVASGNNSVNQPILPVEWLRVKAACTYSGLSKAKIYDLIKHARIKSVSLRDRGQIKGTRLISFDSLRAFLESLATGGENLCSQTTQVESPTAETSTTRPDRGL